MFGICWKAAFAGVGKALYECSIYAAILLIVAGLAQAASPISVGVSSTIVPLSFAVGEVEAPFYWSNASGSCDMTARECSVKATIQVADKGAGCSNPGQMKNKLMDELGQVAEIKSFKIARVEKKAGFSKNGKTHERAMAGSEKLKCGQSATVEVSFALAPRTAPEAINFALGWGTDTSTIVATNAYARTESGRGIVRDTNGYIYVIYRDGTTTDTNTSVYLARSTDDGVSWSSKWVNLTSGLTGCNGAQTGGGNVLAIDSTGKLHGFFPCVNSSNASRWVYYYARINLSGGLEKQTLISTSDIPVSAGYYSLSIAIDSGDRIMLSFQRAPSYYLNATISTDGGNTWASESNALNPGANGIGYGQIIALDGNFWAFGINNTGAGFFVRQYTTSWQTQTYYVAAGTNRIQVVAGSGTKIHLIRENMGGSNYVIEYSNSTNYTQFVAISQNVSLRNLYPSIAADQNGNVIAVWTRLNATSGLRYRISTDNGSTWGTQVNFTSDGSALSLDNLRSSAYECPQCNSWDAVFRGGTFPTTYYDRFGKFLIQTNNGTTSQLNNATVRANIRFNVTGITVYGSDQFAGGIGNCTLTVPSSVIGGASNVSVFDSGAAVKTLNSNTSTTINWNCSQSFSPYSVYYELSPITSNCSDSSTNATGWNAILGNSTSQSAWRDCTLANPNSAAVINVSGNFSCLAGGVCVPDGAAVGMLAATTTIAANQTATDAWISIVASNWTGNATYKTSNVTFTNSAGTALWINYSEVDFPARPAGLPLANVTGNVTIPAGGTATITGIAYNGSIVIAACGVYADNNAHYSLMTFNDYAQTSDCVVISANNSVLDGAWGFIRSGGSSIVINGDNNRIANLSVGSQYGITFNGTATNNTVELVRVVNASVAGVLQQSSGTNFLRAVSITNCTDGIRTAAGNLSVQNVNVFGNTNDVNVVAASIFDSGDFSNYWGNCSGSCSGYSLSSISASNATKTAYLNASNTSQGWNPAISNVTFSDSDDALLAEFAASYAPGAVILGENVSWWGNNSHVGQVLKASWINQSWNESGVACVLSPTYCQSNWSEAALGGGVFEDGPATWVNFTASGANTSAPYVLAGGPVGFRASMNGGGAYAFTVWMRNSSYPPRLVDEWRPSFGSPVSVASSDNATRINYVASGLSLDGAEYCSYVVPKVSDSRAVTNLDTGGVVSGAWSLAKNATHEWLVWSCVNDTFYSVAYGTPWIYATIGECSETYSQIANYSFFDELSRENITANTSSNFSGTDYVYGTFYGSTIQPTNNTHSIVLCRHQYLDNFSATVQTTYYNSSSVVRNYVLVANNATNTTVPLYLLNVSLGSIVRWVTYDQYGQVLPGRLQQFLRYVPSSNSYLLTEVGITDASGQITTQLFVNGTAFYKVIDYRDATNSTIEYIFDMEQVTCSAGESCIMYLIVQVGATLPEFWTDYYGKVQYNCSFINATNTISCIYADSSGTAHEYDLNAFRMSFGDPIAVCSTSSNQASGTLLCTLNDTNTTGRVYSWIFARHSTTTVIASDTVDLRPAGARDDGTKLFIAFLVVVTGGFIGLINPFVGVITGGIALVACNMMGLMDLSMTALAGVILIGGIVAWQMGTYKGS